MLAPDLSPQEHDALLRALRAPSLWAFHLLMSEVGLSEALESCASMTLPEKAEEAFARCAYAASDLPLYEDVTRLIQGVRLKLTWKPKAEPMQTAARRVGLTVQEATRALNTYAAYGARIERLSALRS